jgi:hypothetical protein
LSDEDDSLSGDNEEYGYRKKCQGWCLALGDFFFPPSNNVRLLLCTPTLFLMNYL